MQGKYVSSNPCSWKKKKQKQKKSEQKDKLNKKRDLESSYDKLPTKEKL